MAISKSALVVSSKDARLQQLENQLHQLGFEQVFTTKYSAEALELAYFKKPDIILVNSHIEGRLDTKGLLQAVHSTGIPLVVVQDQQTAIQQNNYVTLDYMKGLDAVQQAVETALNRREPVDTSQENIFFIRTNNRFYRVQSSSIRWIESDGNYSVIQCVDKKFILKMSLRKVLQELSSHNFIQIHKRFIVNVDEIEYIDVSDNKVFLSDKEIPIGRRYKDELLGRLKCLK